MSVMIIYRLDCGHTVGAVSSFVNGVLWCPWHKTESEITGVQTYEWHVYCDNCNFGRWAGTSKGNANLFANAHVRHNRGHVSHVEYKPNPEAVRTQGKMESWRTLKR